MSEKNDGGQAFPNPFVYPGAATTPKGKIYWDYQPATYGMSLRDWFAGQALAGLHSALSRETSWPDNNTLTGLAELAYKQADAMLAERKKP